MIFNHNLLYWIFAALFSLTCVAEEEELIRQSLSKLENSSLYRSLGIRITFKYFDDVAWLSVRLRPAASDALIGDIDYNVHGYDTFLTDIDNLRTSLKDSLTSGDINKDTFIKQTSVIDDFASKVNKNNLAYVIGVGVMPDYRGKGLSYPLICNTLQILKDVFHKSYVYLLDIAEIPDYYKKMGFKYLGGKLKYGLIDELLSGPKCKTEI
ncbi:MAG TPA: hypothetical protein VEL47_07320 [Myxococcota bacterium]|nr:hypothetical protein [Myxococcota bacterium]